MTPVVVTATGVLAPGIGAGSDLGARLASANPVEPYRRLSIAGIECQLTRPQIDPSDPHLPTGREAKAMRRDVRLGVACVGRLFSATSTVEAVRRESGLFVATGLCQDDDLEKQIEEMGAAYVADYACRSEADRNHEFFRSLPPLMALAGLSNACACFIARDYKVCGPNAVFGVTSHAGHAALREGFHAVASGQVTMALVGGANAGGTLSALALASLARGGDRLCEAEAAAFLLLESEDGCATAGRRPLCRVRSVDAVPGVPRPRSPSRPDALRLARRIGDDAPDTILTGGSPFEADECAMREALVEQGTRLKSWFTSIGCAGAASVPLDACTAAHLVSAGEARRAVCVNRDVYGRQSAMTLEAVA